VRVEPGGVGHRHAGPDDGALESAGEVAVAGEPEPPALGVADTQSLDRWGLLLGLFTHGPHPTGGTGVRCARMSR
jgi:hypothetical protein